jgi:hypothetical protein
MKQLRANPIATQLSPSSLGDGGARSVVGGVAGNWSRYAGRRLAAKAVLQDRADESGRAESQVVAQPWHGYENSAPDDHTSQNPSQRINRSGLVSTSPDRRLTGERTAEGWATGLSSLSPAAVVSGDAKYSPRVRIQQFESSRVSSASEAEERNLLP